MYNRDERTENEKYLADELERERYERNQEQQRQEREKQQRRQEQRERSEYEWRHPDDWVVRFRRKPVCVGGNIINFQTMTICFSKTPPKQTKRLWKYGVRCQPVNSLNWKNFKNR